MKILLPYIVLVVASVVDTFIIFLVLGLGVPSVGDCLGVFIIFSLMGLNYWGDFHRRVKLYAKS